MPAFVGERVLKNQGSAGKRFLCSSTPPLSQCFALAPIFARLKTSKITTEKLSTHATVDDEVKTLALKEIPVTKRSSIVTKRHYFPQILTFLPIYTLCTLLRFFDCYLQCGFWPFERMRSATRLRTFDKIQDIIPSFTEAASRDPKQ